MSEPEISSEAADADLVERMATGNREAFASLFRRYHGLVYRFSVQMSGSRDVAEDVTQEVFIALAENHARYRPERGSLRAYMYGIARHLVVQREKRSWSRREVHLDTLQGDDAHIVATSFDPIGDLSRAREVLALRRAILRLPPHYREVIVLCELNGLSYDEAAQAIGCRVGTIRSRLNRARRLLVERCRPCLCPTGNSARDERESPASRGAARILSPESGR
jgi:RNA polymerase sigma-70 factor (ECF subfamily)